MYPQPPQLTQAPIKEIAGHKFYDIRQADQILHSRHMRAEIQEIYIRAGINEAFLKQITDLILDRCDAIQDIKQLKYDMRAIATNLKERIGMISEKAAYEELACVYFLMDDEPSDEYDPGYQAKKKALWRAHPKERDFFILEVFRHMSTSVDISAKDISAVFQIVDERTAQLPTLPQG